MNPPAADEDPTPAARPPRDQATARRLLALMRAGRDARRTKVRHVRSAVRDEAYENDLKLSVAIDRVVAELAE